MSDDDTSRSRDKALESGSPSGMKKLLAFIPVLGLLAAVGYAILWFMASSSLNNAFEDWVEVKRTQGFEVSYAEASVGGFPVSVSLTVQAPSVTAPEDEGGWRWSAERVEAGVRVNNLSRISLNAPGPHRIRLAHDGDGLPPELTVRAAQARAHVTMVDPDRFTDGDFDVTDLVAEGPWPGQMSARRIRGGVQDHRAGPEANHRTTTHTLSLSALDVRLPEAAGVPLGPTLHRLRLTARLLGRVPSGPLDTALNTWRENGGSVEVDDFILEWDPLSLSVKGTMALDEALQPIGALTANFQGFFEAVDSLTEAGYLRSSDASMARVVLGLLSRRPADGGPPILRVPLTIQNSLVYVGPVALYTIPEIVWVETPAEEDMPLRPGFEITPDGQIIERPRRSELEEQLRQERQDADSPAPEAPPPPP